MAPNHTVRDLGGANPETVWPVAGRQAQRPSATDSRRRLRGQVAGKHRGVAASGNTTKVH